MARVLLPSKSGKVKIAAVSILGIGIFGAIVWLAVHTILTDGGNHVSTFCVDLSENFTSHSSDTNSFTDGIVRGPEDLVCLLKNRRKFGDVRFSVTGIIALKGKETAAMPSEQVEAIKIDRGFRLMHLLHGTTGWSSDGVPIASLVFHYEDGSERKTFLFYGKHARDWFQSQENSPPERDTVIAWTMHNPISKEEKDKLRVYRTSVENPRPELKVTTVDYASTLSGCAPFLFGMTLEN